MELEILKELGLSNNESKVYQVLVEFGQVSAGEITSKTDVSHSKIYNILDSLIQKGLVKIIPEKTKKFIPSDPSQFLELIEKKEKTLEKAKSLVNEMKKFYDIKEKNPITVGYGKRAFYKIVKELKGIKEFSYTIKWTSEYREDWAREQRIANKKKLITKSLTRFDKETEKDVKKWLKVNKNIKKLDNEGIALGIRDEQVMISLIKSNCTILIHDKPFVKIMKKLFEAAYDQAEKIQ